MAQLNDLLILGNSNLLGSTNINGPLVIGPQSPQNNNRITNHNGSLAINGLTNPWILFTTFNESTSTYTSVGYLQASGTTLYLGNGSTNSLAVKNNGDVTIPGSLTLGEKTTFDLSTSSAYWRYTSGTTNYDITHPLRTGTIALKTKTDTNELINLLEIGTSIPVDADYYISQYVSGGTSNTNYYRRPMSALWNYVNKKSYGTCSTAAATAEKAVTCANFALATGAKITIKFTVTNTAANPTLNVNSTGAKPIFYRGAAITKGYLAAKRFYTFVYDGTNYELIGDINTDTNTYVRVYRQTKGYNGDYPILVSRTPTAGIATVGSDGSTEGVYAVIGQDGKYTPTVNPHTGQIKIKCNTASSSKTTGALIVTGGVGVSGNIYGNNIYGAVWNDYAEFRDQKEKIEPGYCVASTDSGEVYKTSFRLQPCDGIVSDTFGFAIGETDNCKTPLAVAGRVLAYCEGDRYDYHAGDTVCATSGGLVTKMTRDEIKEYPDRIIGIVSEIPEYDIWGSGNVKVNNRIWIKVK